MYTCNITGVNCTQSNFVDMDDFIIIYEQYILIHKIQGKAIIKNLKTVGTYIRHGLIMANKNFINRQSRCWRVDDAQLLAHLFIVFVVKMTHYLNKYIIKSR